RAGQVPAVIYGENQEPTAIAVDGTAIFYALQKESFHTSLLNIALDGKETQVIVRDFQMHPFKQMVLHVDFQAVDAAKEIKIKLSVGGTFKDDSIIIQGDYRDKIMAILKEKGFKVKRVGG
ncbi:MAG TPA: 50S ribosomal protein L25, partial [Flavobacterium sp.]|nr:50S ribosomal protein L25 [Flavobacterium sp.]